MSMRLDQSKLLSYFRNEINELIEVLERALNFYWPDGDYDYGAKQLIYMDLFNVLMRFAGADRDITDNEAVLLMEVRKLFHAEVKNYDASSPQALKVIRDIFRTDRETFETNRMPSAIELLQRYDSDHGTSYAEKAKAMYMSLAEAMVKADLKETQEEQNKKSEYRELLYPSGDKEIDTRAQSVSSTEVENDPTKEGDDVS